MTKPVPGFSMAEMRDMLDGIDEKLKANPKPRKYFRTSEFEEWMGLASTKIARRKLKKLLQAGKVHYVGRQKFPSDLLIGEFIQAPAFMVVRDGEKDKEGTI